jgi:hypothetical protein
MTIACVVLTRCSLLLGDNLDGLAPYPPEGGGDVRDSSPYDAERRDETEAAPDVRSEDIVADRFDTADVASDRVASDRSDTPELDVAADKADAPLEDIKVADRLDVTSGDQGHLDARDGQANDTAPPADGPPESADASPDGIFPPGDGGIVGIGNWVVSGMGALNPSNYDVRGWMIPSTSLRGTTRSGLTIEGWLQ